MSNDLNEMREHVAVLIDEASSRQIALYEVRSLFKRLGLSARNFDGLKVRLNSIFDEQKLTKLYNQLEELVSSHISYDDKLLSIYPEISNISELDDILTEAFEDIDASDGSTVSQYQPYKSTTPSNNQKLFQFCVIREISVRKNLSPDDLREDMVEDFQAVIGIRKIPLNCHDFILLDFEKNIVVIGIDLARVLGRNELNLAINNFNNYLSKTLGIQLPQSLDLFQKIQEFYDFPISNSNGVIEIFFMTPAGTAHHETLKGDGKDLREATYHRKGAEGVRNEKENGVLLMNEITPYRISTKFYFDSKPPIEISLKSSYLAINTADGSHLYEAYEYGSRDINDLYFVLDKLIN